MSKHFRATYMIMDEKKSTPIISLNMLIVATDHEKAVQQATSLEDRGRIQLHSVSETDRVNCQLIKLLSPDFFVYSYAVMK